ncbi:MAG: desulfoferrodoxin [Lachnospiraceae bacterium]|nr:desulfoferrodoxin [Lachnospiraceae bacterium]
MANNSVFVKNNEEILYLVSGKEDALKNAVGGKFTFLDSRAAEGAGEKHIPIVEKDGQQITVKVGSVFHPMTDEHSIAWIFLETNKGGQFMTLTPQDEPVAHFVLADGDKANAAYAYCNLHGFWKTDIL